MIQARATSTAPTATTGRGPNLSTSQPSIGTSHVSTTTKMEKASWMLALTQSGCAVCMGFTKSVQPYCRLATSPMQAIPMTSCVQRFEMNDAEGAVAVCDAA